MSLRSIGFSRNGVEKSCYSLLDEEAFFKIFRIIKKDPPNKDGEIESFSVLKERVDYESAFKKRRVDITANQDSEEVLVDLLPRFNVLFTSDEDIEKFNDDKFEERILLNKENFIALVIDALMVSLSEEAIKIYQINKDLEEKVLALNEYISEISEKERYKLVSELQYIRFEMQQRMQAFLVAYYGYQNYYLAIRNEAIEVMIKCKKDIEKIDKKILELKSQKSIIVDKYVKENFQEIKDFTSLDGSKPFENLDDDAIKNIAKNLLKDRYRLEKDILKKEMEISSLNQKETRLKNDLAALAKEVGVSLQARYKINADSRIKSIKVEIENIEKQKESLGQERKLMIDSKPNDLKTKLKENLIKHGKVKLSDADSSRFIEAQNTNLEKSSSEMINIKKAKIAQKDKKIKKVKEFKKEIQLVSLADKKLKESHIKFESAESKILTSVAPEMKSQVENKLSKKDKSLLGEKYEEKEDDFGDFLSFLNQIETEDDKKKKKKNH